MQTNFDNSINSQALLLGQVYDDSMAQIDSYVAENEISFGQAVQLGTDPETQVKALVTDNKFFGIAIRQNMATSGGAVATSNTQDSLVTMSVGKNEYPAGSQIAILKFGRVAVKVDTVSNSDVGTTQAWYQVSTGKITAKNGNPTTGYDSLGVFVTKPVAGNLAVIQVNKII